MTEILIPDVQTLDAATLTPIGFIALYFLLALIMSLLSHRIARRMLSLRRLLPGKRNITVDRLQTLEGLIGSMISLIVFIAAILASFSLFVEPATLVWIVGLFSAAFGLGARALVADVLAGGRFIFRNTFAIGEKVELNMMGVLVEGIVEEVNVTNTLVRSPTGELYVVPNGDIGVIRNFSRAPYSSIKIRFGVRSEQLAQALALLEPLGETALAALPELTAPWQVLSTAEVMGHRTELTVMAHTSFGKAAGLRLRMFDLIYRNLHGAGIELLD